MQPLAVCATRISKSVHDVYEGMHQQELQRKPVNYLKIILLKGIKKLQEFTIKNFMLPLLNLELEMLLI